MCQGLTKSYAGLLVVRFLMGTFEASLPAGATYLISVYYTKREAALRFAWFFNFALAGPLFSGLLAYAIQNMDGTAGYQGWRWVFIIEGCRCRPWQLTGLSVDRDPSSNDRLRLDIRHRILPKSPARRPDLVLEARGA